MPFALTIFLAALLLFGVQLILGKFILPWFGGAPAVWTTCILFFQTVLLVGYAYAHFSSTRLSVLKQARLHLALLTGTAFVLTWFWWKWGLPVLPHDSWKPEEPGQPIRQMLKLLVVCVGFPFLLLSATSPLLQRWFSLQSTEAKPYRLYALSNAGSMLGLLSFPLVIEPLTQVPLQARVWGAGYLLFVIGSAICAVKVLRNPRLQIEPEHIPSAQSPSPHWPVVLVWVLLAAATSSMFLSVTNMLCQDIGVVPLLWVLPLAIYLMSFILCFESARWYRRGGFVIATGVATLLVPAFGSYGSSSTLSAQILCLGLFLFLFCMTCHGELVRLKPEPRHLTLFFSMVALGGLVGSVFVGLIAPLIFKGYWEFHLTLVTGWILLALIFERDRDSIFHRGDRRHFACLVLLTAYFILDFVLPFTPLRHADWYWKNLLVMTCLSAAIVTASILWLTWRRPLSQFKFWPQLLLAWVIVSSANLAWRQIRHKPNGTVDEQRNFYGVVRVVRSELRADGTTLPVLRLTHGRVNHGSQIQDEVWRNQPVGYYATNSGIELAFRFHPRRGKLLPTHIGVLGLGVGTLAAFAREGDLVRFYEINPAVSSYCAGNEPVFTYLPDCKGRAEVAPGDARLSLESELRNRQPARFDILVMDAFSGDSVPVHLLTVEAFETYQAHLRDLESIIAVNVSNQFLDLRDLMLSLGRRFDLEVVFIHCPGSLPDPTSSRWCLLTRNKNFVQLEPIQNAREDYSARREILWTDDFSNLFQLLR